MSNSSPEAQTTNPQQLPAQLLLAEPMLHQQSLLRPREEHLQLQRLSVSWVLTSAMSWLPSVSCQSGELPVPSVPQSVTFVTWS